MSMFGTEGGFDMNALLAQAQAMQEQMQSAQSELAARTVTGTRGRRPRHRDDDGRR